MKFKYEVGCNLINDKRDFIITNREVRPRNRKDGYIENEKWYKYICRRCGYTDGWIIEGDLAKGNGCSCCNGYKAVLGINTIWDKARWMCNLGVSENDAKKYRPKSSKK